MSDMLIVWFKRMFVNRDFTSKDKKRWPVGIFSDFMLLIDSILLVTVYSNLLSGETNLARCLLDWYDAVPILDVIGSIEI